LQAQPKAEVLYSTYFMGHLQKLSRRRRWQRRWLVLEPEKQRLLVSRRPGDAPTKVLALVGAQLVQEEAANAGEERLRVR
jgi:hypothetical protein